MMQSVAAPTLVLPSPRRRDVSPIPAAAAAAHGADHRSRNTFLSVSGGTPRGGGADAAEDGPTSANPSPSASGIGFHNRPFSSSSPNSTTASPQLLQQPPSLLVVKDSSSLVASPLIVSPGIIPNPPPTSSSSTTMSKFLTASTQGLGVRPPVSPNTSSRSPKPLSASFLEGPTIGTPESSLVRAGGGSRERVDRFQQSISMNAAAPHYQLQDALTPVVNPAHMRRSSAFAALTPVNDLMSSSGGGGRPGSNGTPTSATTVAAGGPQQQQSALSSSVRAKLNREEQQQHEELLLAMLEQVKLKLQSLQQGPMDGKLWFPPAPEAIAAGKKLQQAMEQLPLQGASGLQSLAGSPLFGSPFGSPPSGGGGADVKSLGAWSSPFSLIRPPQAAAGSSARAGQSVRRGRTSFAMSDPLAASSTTAFQEGILSQVLPDRFLVRWPSAAPTTRVPHHHLPHPSSAWLSEALRLLCDLYEDWGEAGVRLEKRDDAARRVQLSLQQIMQQQQQGPRAGSPGGGGGGELREDSMVAAGGGALSMLQPTRLSLSTTASGGGSPTGAAPPGRTMERKKSVVSNATLAMMRSTRANQIDVTDAAELGSNPALLHSGANLAGGLGSVDPGASMSMLHSITSSGSSPPAGAGAGALAMFQSHHRQLTRTWSFEQQSTAALPGAAGTGLGRNGSMGTMRLVAAGQQKQQQQKEQQQQQNHQAVAGGGGNASQQPASSSTEQDRHPPGMNRNSTSLPNNNDNNNNTAHRPLDAQQEKEDAQPQPPPSMDSVRYRVQHVKKELDMMRQELRRGSSAIAAGATVSGGGGRSGYGGGLFAVGVVSSAQDFPWIRANQSIEEKEEGARPNSSRRQPLAEQQPQEHQQQYHSHACHSTSSSSPSRLPPSGSLVKSRKPPLNHSAVSPRPMRQRRCQQREGADDDDYYNEAVRGLEDEVGYVVDESTPHRITKGRGTECVTPLQQQQHLITTVSHSSPTAAEVSSSYSAVQNPFDPTERRRLFVLQSILWQGDDLRTLAEHRGARHTTRFTKQSLESILRIHCAFRCALDNALKDTLVTKSHIVNFSNITHLEITGANLGDEGCLIVLLACREGPLHYVESLDLMHNQLTAASAFYCGVVLLLRPPLQWLDVKQNEAFRAMEETHVAAAPAAAAANSSQTTASRTAVTLHVGPSDSPARGATPQSAAAAAAAASRQRSSRGSRTVPSIIPSEMHRLFDITQRRRGGGGGGAIVAASAGGASVAAAAPTGTPAATTGGSPALGTGADGNAFAAAAAGARALANSKVGKLSGAVNGVNPTPFSLPTFRSARALVRCFFPVFFQQWTSSPYEVEERGLPLPHPDLERDGTSPAHTNESSASELLRNSLLDSQGDQVVHELNDPIDRELAKFVAGSFKPMGMFGNVAKAVAGFRRGHHPPPPPPSQGQQQQQTISTTAEDQHGTNVLVSSGSVSPGTPQDLRSTEQQQQQQQQESRNTGIFSSSSRPTSPPIGLGNSTLDQASANDNNNNNNNNNNQQSHPPHHASGSTKRRANTVVSGSSHHPATSTSTGAPSSSSSSVPMYLTDRAKLSQSRDLNNAATSIVSLRLGWNDLEDSGAVLVADWLAMQNFLMELSLDFNDIGEPGAAALRDALRSTTALVSFGLEQRRGGNRSGSGGPTAADTDSASNAAATGGGVGESVPASPSSVVTHETTGSLFGSPTAGGVAGRSAVFLRRSSQAVGGTTTGSSSTNNNNPTVRRGNPTEVGSAGGGRTGAADGSILMSSIPEAASHVMPIQALTMETIKGTLLYNRRLHIKWLQQQQTQFLTQLQTLRTRAVL